MIDLHLQQVLLRQGGFQLRANAHIQATTLGLSGRSGGGKTTLLELIAGLRRPDQGQVSLGDECLDDAPLGRHVPTRLRRIGYVPQDADLFPHLDVRRNLTFGAGRADAGGPGIQAVTMALGLDDLLGRSSAGLSGGERRRVALARALLSGPQLLLLDEPFSGLDAAARRMLRTGLRVLNARFHIPWILVSHDPADLRGLCERVLHLQDGTLTLGEIGKN